MDIMEPNVRKSMLASAERAFAAAESSYLAQTAVDPVEKDALKSSQP
jgi:hypothetical protein